MYYTFIYYECIIWCMYTKGCIKCYILLWLFTKVSIYYRFLVCIALYKYTMYVNCGYIKLLKTYEMHVPHMAATTAWGGSPHRLSWLGSGRTPHCGCHIINEDVSFSKWHNFYNMSTSRSRSNTHACSFANLVSSSNTFLKKTMNLLINGHMSI